MAHPQDTTDLNLGSGSRIWNVVLDGKKEERELVNDDNLVPNLGK